jgi:methylamine---glutamate N-methyltransferase subunit B
MTTPPAGSERPVPVVSIPDIRDYQRINAELVARLDTGHGRVRLAGAEGQRLLVSGLSGAWDAVIEVEGRAGPELAAAMNAPGLTVVCGGPAADGAGRGLRAGRLVIRGDAGPALGYAMEGGTIVALGSVGPRAGLNQRGGLIVALGAVGPLAAERQAGGRFFAFDDQLGPHAGRGRRGGTFGRFVPGAEPPRGIDPEDLASYFEAGLDEGVFKIGPTDA